MQASDRPGKIGEFMNTTQIYEQHSYQNIYKYSWDSHSDSEIGYQFKILLGVLKLCFHLVKYI